MVRKKKQNQVLGYLEKIEISGFKRFSQLKFEDLGMINVFLGSNNTGKTSILESIFSFACGNNLRPLIDSGILREKEINGPYDFAEKLMGGFYDFKNAPFSFSFNAQIGSQKFNVKHTLSPFDIYNELLPHFESSLDKETSYNEGGLQFVDGKLVESRSSTPIVKWNVDINGKKTNQDIHYPYGFNLDNSTKPIKLGRYIDILHHRNQNQNVQIFASLKREGILDNFIDEVKTTFKRVENIDVIPYPDGKSGPVVFKIKNRGNLPIYNFGDGLVRWYNILGGMLLYQNAIHCIEEIDSTFHPTAQIELVKNLVKYSEKFSNQVFLTSHSLEFVDNMLDAIEPNIDTLGEKIRFITIKNDDNGNPITRTLNGTEAFKSRNKFKIDLR